MAIERISSLSSASFDIKEMIRVIVALNVNSIVLVAVTEIIAACTDSQRQGICFGFCRANGFPRLFLNCVVCTSSLGQAVVSVVGPVVDKDGSI